MSAPSQPDRQMGLLSRLVDDALIRILRCRDAIDLLRIERTCKDLKSLVAKREAWLAAILRLPREASLGIAPYQTYEDTDLRELVLKAIRGYKNWTSKHPKPLRRRLLDLSPVIRMRRLRLLPGGRYMVYFTGQTLCCFDVVKNQYVIRYSPEGRRLLNYVYDMNFDGRSVRTFIASESENEPGPGQPREMIFEYIDIDLNLCMNSPSHRIVLDQSDLARAAKVTCLGMIRNSTSRKDILFTSFEGRDIIDWTMVRGGIFIDFDKGLILILTFKHSDSAGDHKLFTCVASNHLLYFSGRTTGNPTIHAVPLSCFDNSWQDISNPATWVSHKLKAEHGTHFSFVDHTLEAPVRMHAQVHPGSWLDVEIARSRDPTITCVSLIDVGISYDGPDSDALSKSKSFFHLQFSESRNQLSGELFCQFSMTERPTMMPMKSLSDRNGVLEALPSRHGRMFALIFRSSWPNRTGEAVSLLRDSVVFTPLKHLKSTVNSFVIDFYTGTVIVHTAPKEPGLGGSILFPGPTGVFVEYYD